MPLLSRKKSGEPLKSSLKAKRTPARGSLTVITDPVGLNSSKGAPATPAHKGVRFDSQLAHVKLFLAEQKPLAVSRDGSPTDTSGTESEFPSFIYGRGDNFKERPLIMRRIDVPTSLPSAEDLRDVAVENIEPVGTTVEGVIRVRNLAFGKWIAVRFTLDKWQTTSEVTARYKESLPNGTMDRFIFTIKLADVLSRAEEKTIYLAVRYSVASREIWDNNRGRNYHIQIVREKVLKTNKERQLVVFSPNTRVADGDRRLRHQALLVDIRHRALNQRVPLQRDIILPHRCIHPGVHPQFPMHLLTRAQTLTPRRGRTQYHDRSLHVFHMVLPAIKLKSHCCSLTMIQTVIATRMTRSPWRLPYAGVARAVVRVTIFEEELLNFHTRLP
jgi:hypothetical protein